MTKPNLTIPLKRGQQLELTVETLGASGDGICRHEGYALFAPDTLPGDRILAEVIKLTTNWGSVRTLKRISDSPDRIEPDCPVFPECGGCQLQDLSYEKQLQFKMETLTETLKRIGKVEDLPPVASMESERAFRYRNKGIFPIQFRQGKLCVGFYRRGSHKVVDSPVCNVMLDSINDLKEALRELFEKHDISVYNEKKNKGFLRHLVIRRSEARNETLLGFVTTPGEFRQGFLNEILKKSWLDRFRIKGVVQNINESSGNVIFGAQNRCLWGSEFLLDEHDGISFQIGLDSFFQVNSRQAERLYALIESWVTPGDGLILDAFSGVGSIALRLARSGRRVKGIESFAGAVENARESARLNGLDCEFIHAEVESHFQTLIDSESVQTLVLDPPRKGCDPQFIEAVQKIAPEQIIYISCNPSTLARDINLLQDYQIKKAVLTDMFPQTRHIESALLLERRGDVD
ncbi:MAG: 23S rRNA (uracil(1939)-C(5))-methyltransferase RlmD [Candidatus Nitrohelix vancouverensis]|uniref:23S rRNA (Uracil(1939)-C(5))-methyltransferase RlmD n=1 Tax=Candidatus Nitrohelix vancouverensis TaxID=2705534 RepID=A0A7T0C4Q4_9BACT|nr:MAG: 23S rRNA (uracil(1939)-C(5))-methyltransferase RlmD [Candidatus Nitrohelix vancouverensis]